MPEPLLSIKDLTTTFGGFKALNGVDLIVQSGDAIGLVGPNGSGKTTLVNTACGLYRPSSGDIVLNGTNINRFAPHKRARLGVNRTFQIPKPFKDLTVSKNIEVGLNHSSSNSSVEELLAFVGLDGAKEVPAGSLTAIAQKKLDLARALALDPKVLFVDELAAGLTPGEQIEIATMLRDLQSRGMALVIVEHLLGFLELVTDSVVVLSAGSVIFRGHLREAVEDQQVRTVFLGGSSDA